MKTKLSTPKDYIPTFVKILILILGGSLLYYSSLDNGFFTLDDVAYVQNNELIKQGSWLQFFTQPFEGMYQPLLLMSFSVDYWLGGGSPWWFHLTNVLLHLANSVLVFYLFKQLNRKESLAWMAAALFLMHPAMVETTAWITSRKDLLFSLFYLAGLITWLRYLETSRKNYVYLTGGLFILSLLSKSQAVTFPLALILLEYLQSKTFSLKKSLIQKWPFLLFSLIIGILVYVFAIGERPDLEAGERIVYGSYAFSYYLIHSFFPFTNMLLHPFPAEMQGNHLLGLLVLPAIGYLFYRYRQNKVVVAGLLFFILHIFLLLPFLPNSFIFYANKYLYLSLIGILLIYIYLYDKIVLQNKWALFFLPFLIVFIHGTNKELQQWDEPILIWDEVTETYPESTDGWENRGYYYYTQQEPEKALENFKQSIRINPNRFNAQSNAGAILTDLHQYEDALKHLDIALKLVPGNEACLFNRSIAYQYTGKLDKALLDIEEVIQKKPLNADYLLTRGAILLNSGEFPSALKDFESSIQLNPKNYIAYSNRGLCHIRLGEMQKAYDDFTTTLNLKSDFPDAWSNRGLLLLNQGKAEDAVRDLSNAIRLAPGFGLAYMNRGRAWIALGQQTHACEDFTLALQYGVGQAQAELNQYCSSALP